MEIVNDFTDAQRSYWSESPGATEVTMKAPEGMANCAPCPAIVTKSEDGLAVVRVAWKPNEIDLAHLANGGTIWLSTWGGLPPHMLEVQPPS